MPGFSSVVGLTNADKNVANGIAGLDAEGNLGKPNFSIGTNTYHSHDAESGINNAAMTLLKTITLTWLPATTLRIYFEIASVGTGNTVSGRLYKNGVGVGTLRGTSAGIWVGFTENLSDWAIGDTLELWGSKSAGNAGKARNFRIVYEPHATLANS